MTSDQINLLASLIGATLSLDTNNNYVVTTPTSTKTVSPGDINDALLALATYISQTQSSLQSSPSAATLAALMSTIQSI
jgi:hypothetical protein